jgi:hypothetical protein
LLAAGSWMLLLLGAACLTQPAGGGHKI